MSDKFAQVINELTQVVDFIDTYYSSMKSPLISATMPNAIKHQILKIEKNICELELIQNKAQKQHIESKIKQYHDRMLQCVQK